MDPVPNQTVQRLTWQTDVGILDKMLKDPPKRFNLQSRKDCEGRETFVFPPLPSVTGKTSWRDANDAVERSKTRVPKNRLLEVQILPNYNLGTAMIIIENGCPKETSQNR